MPCFNVTDLDGEDGNVDAQKQLKTEAAKRIVPIHPELIALGLLEYVDQLRESGEQRLFPAFKRDPSNGWGRKLGRWANDTFLVQLGYKRNRIVFHSFRHTVITRLGQAGVQEPIIKALVGHEQQGVLQISYFAEGYTVRQLADAIAMLGPSSLGEAKRMPSRLNSLRQRPAALRAVRDVQQVWDDVQRRNNAAECLAFVR